MAAKYAGTGSPDLRGARIALLLAVLAAPLAGGWADYNPPVGTGGFYDLSSPEFLMQGPSSVSSSTPYADALNPAASGFSQRPVVDVSYIGLAGFGTETGLGSALNLGLSVPTKVGVFSGSARLISVPATFASLDFGTVGNLNLSFAKHLYPRLSIGIGLGFVAGAGDWGLGLDLGLVHRPGDLSLFKDFSWGLGLRDLGKWYAPVAGATAFPPPFTPAAGLSFNLVRSPSVRWSFAFDASFPTFQNVRLDGSTSLAILDTVFLSLAGHFDLHETLGTFTTPATPSPRALPLSFGVNVRFKTDTKKGARPVFSTERGWDRSQIDVDLGAAPLQGGIWGIGLGASLKLGEIDRVGPTLSMAAPDTTHLSPGVPGVLDELVLSVSIADLRYVKGYDLTIVNAQGAAVRDIGEREERSNKFFDRLFYVEKQIPLPTQLSWDGKGDDGKLVPDGTYTYKLAAVDDNGNTSETPPAEVVVDNTPPTAEATAEYLVFSPNGDGNKDVLPIQQSGSSEDLWVGTILDSAGAEIRQWSWEAGSPQAASWDGLTKDGVLAPDGTYTYRLGATDRAGNAVSVEIAGIEVNTRPTPVGLSIDKAFFSPNGDGVKDTVLLTLDVPVTSGIERWSMVVRSRERGAVRTFEGRESILKTREFDGRDDAGRALPEGEYTADLSVLYQNGNNPETSSGSFTLDLTSPSVTVKSDFSVFSPNGDGRRDEVTIFQESSDELAWAGEIRDAAKAVVYSLGWRGRVDSRLVWNGRGPEGQLLPDGRYTYLVSSTDRAGNLGQSEPIVIDLNTEDTQIFLSTDLSSFSPNADRVKDRLRILPQLRVTEGIREYELKVVDASNAVVRSYSGRASAPEPISWDGLSDDGKRVPDGAYRAEFHIVYVKGDEHSVRVGPFTVDTVAPDVSLSVADLLYSPDGDGRKDQLAVKQRSSEEDLWEAEIRDSNGKTMRSLYWKGVASDVSWDGRDDVGNRAADGLYAYRIGSTDKAGNAVLKEISGIEIDTRPTPVYASVQSGAFSPNGDGAKDDVTVKLILGLKEGIKGWKLDMRHATRGVQRTFSSDTAIPAQVIWDGRLGSGSLAPEGSYEARLEVEYLKGNLPNAVTTPFILDVTPPKVTQSVSPAAFSPDEDGVNDVLTIQTGVEDISPIDRWSMRIIDPSVAVFATYSGTGAPTARLSWDGLAPTGTRARDATTYRLQTALEDAAGNATSTQINVPVTVRTPSVRLTPPDGRIVFSPDGDGLKDSVTIGQDSSDEKSWTGEVRDASSRVLRSYSWSGKLGPLVWDGKDAFGRVVQDGLYSYVVRAPKRADVAPEARVADIRVDSRPTPLALSVSAERFSPNADGKLDTVDVGLSPGVADGVASWKLEMTEDTGGVQRTFTGTGAPPATQRWDGKTGTGATAPEGSYRGVLSMEYEKGNRPSGSSTAVVLDVSPPKASLSLAPKPFSPDADGTDDVLSIGMKAEDAGTVTSWSLKILDPTELAFIDYSGAGMPPERISWDGLNRQGELVQAATDYPAVLTVQDDVGNVAVVRDLIPVDVLVIREGDRLKIRISSITFPANLSDLSKVDDPAKADRNTKTLKRIAEILNKFSTYRIRVEGHANSVFYYDAARAKREQDEELLPLSKSRAEAVKTVLVQYGVREDRMTTVGLGGSEPVIQFSDQTNNWKNRRVEFVLTER